MPSRSSHAAPHGVEYDDFRRIAREMVVAGWQAAQSHLDSVGAGVMDSDGEAHFLLSSPAHSGDPADILDAVAREAMNGVAAVHLPGAPVGGEEGWNETRSLPARSYVVLIDPVDGTTQALTTRENWASVALIFQRRPSGRFEFRAGAIAYSSGHLHTFARPMGDVRWGKAYGDPDEDQTVADLAPPTHDAIAMNASKRSRFEPLVDELRSGRHERVGNLAGTPLFCGLIQGGMAALVDTRACLPCDGAGLIPHIWLGGTVVDIDSGEIIGRDQLLDRLESSDLVSKVIPPYVAAKSLPTARGLATDMALHAVATSDGALPFR